MAWSEHMARIRAKVGNDLLLVPAAGVALFDRHRRVLLARHRHDDRWGTPGGGIEPGETPEAATRREFVEETGIELHDAAPNDRALDIQPDRRVMRPAAFAWYDRAEPS